MQPNLDELIERARQVTPTPAEQEAQRRSWAYGNVHLDNPTVTRKMVDEAAEAIDREEKSCG